MKELERKIKCEKLMFRYRVFHIAVANAGIEVWNVICNSFNLVFVPQDSKIWTLSDNPN